MGIQAATPGKKGLTATIEGKNTDDWYKPPDLPPKTNPNLYLRCDTIWT